MAREIWKKREALLAYLCEGLWNDMWNLRLEIHAAFSRRKCEERQKREENASQKAASKAETLLSLHLSLYTRKKAEEKRKPDVKLSRRKETQRHSNNLSFKPVLTNLARNFSLKHMGFAALRAPGVLSRLCASRRHRRACGHYGNIRFIAEGTAAPLWTSGALWMVRNILCLQPFCTTLDKQLKMAKKRGTSLRKAARK